MKTISIYNLNKERILLFSNFSFHYNIIDIINCKLDIQFECFKVDKKIEFELFDLKNLLSGLQSVYNKQRKIIGFYPISKQFSLQFNMLEKGQIKVNVEVWNTLFDGNLHFEFIMDQSFIPDLINEIELILSN